MMAEGKSCVYNFSCETDHRPASCTAASTFTLDLSFVTASIVIGCTILLLNLLILWTARKRHCRTAINTLVYGLCIEDLLTALIIIPLFIASFKSERLFLSPLCNLYGMSVVFMSMASGSTVCLISILQTFAYLDPINFRCYVRRYKVRISSIVRYVLMFLFVLPCALKEEFYFQYDSSGHMCTWNYNGHISADQGKFNYLKFATWFYPLFGLLKIFLMVGSVALAIVLVARARYRLKKHGTLCRGGGRNKAFSQNLAEGVLLSLSYLMGVAFLIISQINDYLVPRELQIGFMVNCVEWNVFKTAAIFLTSLMNQFAIGLKNKRIRTQLIKDVIRDVILRKYIRRRLYGNMRRFSRGMFNQESFRFRSATQLQLSETTSTINTSRRTHIIDTEIASLAI